MIGRLLFGLLLSAMALFATPVDAVRGMTLPVKGLYLNYEDPSSNPMYNWLYVTPDGGSVYKLEGPNAYGGLDWTLYQGGGQRSWEDVIVSSDGRHVSFGDAVSSGCGGGDASLEGTIQSTSGYSPLPGVEIYLTGDNGSECHTVTDENGVFQFENILGGHYTLNIADYGYLDATSDFTVTDGQENQFGSLILITWDEYFYNTRFSGHILNAVSGEGVANATVKLHSGYYRPNAPVVQTFTTDASGAFTAEVPADYYTAEVSHAGYTTNESISFSVFGETLTKDFTLNPILNAHEVRIVLTWGENPHDLDSHLTKMDGDTVKYHIYFDHKTASASEVSGNESASLDHDDVTSYGPETITLTNMVPSSTYKYYVHHFSGSGSIATTSQATVTVYFGEHTYTFRAPSGSSTADVWKVFEIHNGVIVPCEGACLYSASSAWDMNAFSRSANRNQNNVRTLLNGESELFTDKKK